MKIVNVVFDIPLERSFYYLCDEEIFNFVRVRVPFGKVRRTGFIIDISDKFEKEIEYKRVEKIYDRKPLISEEIFKLCKSISRKYYIPLGQVIFSIVGNFPLRYKREDRKEKRDELFKDLLFFKKEIYLFDNENEKIDFYVDLINKINGSIILLSPEVSTVEEIFNKIRGKIDKEVIKYYGEMRKKERFENYLKAIEGERFVIIGTRISLFLPLSDLSLIIVDSHIDPSYKEKKHPKINFVEIAEERCLLRNIPLFLVSHTFSIKDYYEMKNKKIRIIDRRKFEKLPQIIVVEKKWDEIDPNTGFLTKLSTSFIEETVLSGKKVGIIHNRKGSLKTFKCEECGHVLRCKICNSILIFSEENKMFCKYCKKIFEFIEKCPNCGSKKIIERIIGIEKIYRILKKTYPDFKIQKYTREEKKLQDSDIFVGTKIISKILNRFDFGLIIFPHADSFLNLPEYNSEEIFFFIVNEFLWKMDKNSKIILQTKNINLEIFNSLKYKKFESFYEKEISIRKMVEYPPFSNIFLIEIPFKKSHSFENRVNILRKIIQKSNPEILFSDMVFDKRKKKIKIVAKLDKENKFDFERLMEMREKLDFKIEINPEVF